MEAFFPHSLQLVSESASVARSGVASNGATHSRPASSPRPNPLKERDWPVFHGVLAGLREFVPAGLPVIVRAATLDGSAYGTCGHTHASFVIKLAGNLGQQQAIDVLLHEWSHALSWSHALDKLARDPELPADEFELASHDSAWGCAFSRVWRAYSGVIVPGLRAGMREGA